jgi:hypothetical protein
MGLIRSANAAASAIETKILQLNCCGRFGSVQVGIAYS